MLGVKRAHAAPMDGLHALAEWTDWLEARGASPETIRSYTGAVSSFLVRYVKGPPSEATSGDVVRFLSERGKRGPHGRRQALKGLKSAYSYWVPAGICSEDPTTLVKETKGRIRRRPVALTEEELARYFFAAAVRDPRRAWTLMFAFGIGARRGEITHVTPDDVQGDRVHLRVCKNGDTRQPPLSPLALVALEELKPWYNGTVLGGIKPDTITDWAHQAAKDSGLYPKVRGRVAHVLRSSFVSHLLRRGVAPQVVAEMVGHRSLSTTSIYAACFEGDDQKAAALVPGTI